MTPPTWVRTTALAAVGVLSFLIVMLGTIPVVFWSSTFFSAVRASRVLGYWPSYDHPDPKAMPAEFWSQAWPVEYGPPVATALVLSGFATLAILRKSRPWAWVPLAFAAFVTLALLGIGLFFLDPGGTLEWYFD